MTKHDLVIVGTGAGLNILEEALRAGWSCAVVESEKFGGTCLTRGCIPSKILIQPADIIREAERAGRLGLRFERPDIDWNTIADRMWLKIGEGDEIERNLTGISGLTIYRGLGEFTGERRMRVNLNGGRGWSEEFAGERFVLATGARSAVPPIEGLEETGYLTTETFFGERFPAGPWPSLIVIGGGLIAVELGHAFSAFGSRVSVVEALPHLLPSEEPEVGALVERVFRSHMDIYVNSRAVAARKTASGKKAVTCLDQQTGRSVDIEADEILIAAGRRSNADLLKPEMTGVDVDARGWIKTNEFLETSRAGIWAIGDALGSYQFRHKANADAGVCTHNLLHGGEAKAAVDYSAVPWAVYTHPRVGHVGLTERQALDADHEILVAVHHYSRVARGFAMGYEPGDADDGFVKLVIERSGNILGAHVVGPDADILVQPFVYLMNAGFTCPRPEQVEGLQPKDRLACPGAGTITPIYRSMVIHPSLNELTAWAVGLLEPVAPKGPTFKAEKT